MIRRITNFASYEAERAAKVPHWQRVLWAALRVVLLALAVSLAALFLFPTKTAHAEVQSHKLTTLTFGPITSLTL